MTKVNQGAVEGYKAVKDVARGEYVKLRAEHSKVYVRGAYDRETRCYSLIDTDDMNREVFKKGTYKVFVGFTY